MHICVAGGENRVEHSGRPLSPSSLLLDLMWNLAALLLSIITPPTVLVHFLLLYKMPKPEEFIKEEIYLGSWLQRLKNPRLGNHIW